jgi:hypothetical protein
VPHGLCEAFLVEVAHLRKSFMRLLAIPSPTMARNFSAMTVLAGLTRFACTGSTHGCRSFARSEKGREQFRRGGRSNCLDIDAKISRASAQVANRDCADSVP